MPFNCLANSTIQFSHPFSAHSPANLSVPAIHFWHTCGHFFGPSNAFSSRSLANSSAPLIDFRHNYGHFFGASNAFFVTLFGQLPGASNSFSAHLSPIVQHTLWPFCSLFPLWSTSSSTLGKGSLKQFHGQPVEQQEQQFPSRRPNMPRGTPSL